MPFIPNSSYNGHTFLKNKHIETVFPALFRNIHINYTRERINTSDQDFIDLDWIEKGNSKLMILFHGLEGSSSSEYIKGFAQFFSQKGFDICAVNFRGCSGEDNLMMRSYHSGATDDVNDLINHIIQNKNYLEIAMVGFSLGGNVVLKYIGEQHTSIHSSIKCAVVFSVPCNLEASANTLAKRENKIYMYRFLQTLIQKMKNKAVKFPGFPSIKDIDKITDFKEFDNRYTAPINGFTDAVDYWTKCSSKNFIKNIQIPTLLVNAKNDPFLSDSCFPISEAKESTFFYLEIPEHGGHVGFSMLLPNGEYWSEKRTNEFMNDHIYSLIEKKN